MLGQLQTVIGQIAESVLAIVGCPGGYRGTRLRLPSR